MNKAMVLLGLLLIIASVSSLDSTSVYAGQTIEKQIDGYEQVKKGIIPDMPDTPGKKVTATVLDNTDTCLINCEIILNITSEIILIPSDVSASFKDVLGRAQSREYEYAWLATSTRTIECYEDITEEVNTTIFNNQTQQNETVLINVTTTKQVFCGFEDYTYWESGLPLVNAGESTVIKIKGKKRYDENIDVIPSLYGIQFKEWAWWNSSGTFDYWAEDNRGIWFNLSLVTDHTMELEINSSQASDTGNCTNIFGYDCSFDTVDGWTEVDASNHLSLDGGELLITDPDKSSYFYLCTGGVNLPASNAFNATYNLRNLNAITVVNRFTAFMATTQMGDAAEAIAGPWDGSTFDILYSTSTYPYVVNDTDTNAGGGAYDTDTRFVRYDFDGENLSVKSYNGAMVLQTTYTAQLMTTPNTMDTVCISSYFGGSSSSTTDWKMDNVTIVGDWGEIITITCANITATQHRCNITTDTNLTDYQVLIPYSEVGVIGSNLSVGIAPGAGGNPPTLISQELGPATLYKNTTAWCAVSYNHTTNTTYTAVMGLAINGTIVGSYNQTNTAYSNGTIWNYTNFDISAYTHGDNVSCWSYANTTNESGDFSDTNYTANIVISNAGPDIENLTITSPLYSDENATGTADFWDLEGDTINCEFRWFVNHSSVYNDSQTPCTNSSLFTSGNYTVDDIVNYIVNATDSEGGTGGPINSSEVIVSGPFAINNYTYTTPQYETVKYNYSLNFSVSAGDENVSVNLEYHDTNITAGCTNVSEVYYCTVENLEAYPIASNGTIEESIWWVEYDSIASGALNQTQEFNVTLYESIWAINITSEVEAIEQLPTQVNVTYGYITGIQGTVSGSALLGSSSSSLTCSLGNCTATLMAPDVDAPTLYQTEANLTLTSSYWSETSNKEVRIENSYSMVPATSGICYLGANCANGYDNNWASSYTAAIGGHTNVSFSLGTNYYLDYWEVKDQDATSNKTINEDCIGDNVTFQFETYGTWDARYYCVNQSDNTLILLDTDASGTHGFKFYESMMYYSQNNSYTWVTPFGLTNCSSGEYFLNYSCRDEDTQSLMTCNYSQTFTVVSAAGTTYETFSGEAQEWNVCYYPLGLEANVSSIEQYGSTGYNVRDYFLFGVATGNVSYNQTIFLASDTDSKLTYIYVKNAGVPVAGAYVYVQKHFVDTNTFNTVAMVKTDDTDGKGNTYLVPNDVWYRFLVLENGEVVYQSETQHVACAPTDSHCNVVLNIQESNVEAWDYIDGIASNCTFTNATKIVACTFVVVDGTQHSFTLYVYNISKDKILLHSNTTTTASGTLWYDIGGDSLEGRYTYYLIAESTPWVLQGGTLSFLEDINWGEDGLVIALVIILVCTMMFAMAGPTMAVIGAYLGLVISWVTQLLVLGPLDLEIIIGIGIAVGVIVYVFREP